jgi:hypothetical protein
MYPYINKCTYIYIHIYLQVAFKNSKGDVVTELLHSKLLTRHWPSKAAMEKKIQDFVTKCGVATHPLYDANATSDGYGSDGLGIYVCTFLLYVHTCTYISIICYGSDGLGIYVCTFLY